MTGRRILSVCVAAIALNLGIGGCGADSRRLTIVRVAGSTVTATDFDHWMKVMAPQHIVPSPQSYTACIGYQRALRPELTHDELLQTCRKEYQQLKSAVLNFLIVSRWYIGAAAENGLGISKRDVRQAISEKRHSSLDGEAEFAQLLHLGGHTIQDVELEVQAELAAAKLRRWLIRHAHDVRSAEVIQYYRRHRRDFHVPGRRTLGVFGTNRGLAGVRTVLAKVAKGKPFLSMSFHETLTNNGLNTLAHEKQTFYEAVFRARPHILVGPLRINGAYYLFEVSRAEPEHVLSFREARPTIIKKLETSRRVAFVTAWRRTWIQRTRCISRYVIQRCVQYHGTREPEDPLDIN